MTAIGRPIAFAANETVRVHVGSTKMVSAREITKKTTSSVKAKAPMETRLLVGYRNRKKNASGRPRSATRHNSPVRTTISAVPYTNQRMRLYVGSEITDCGARNVLPYSPRR